MKTLTWLGAGLLMLTMTPSGAIAGGAGDCVALRQNAVDCVLVGCEETSGTGVGSVTGVGSDMSAQGGWLNGCGGQGHDDQASGSWFGDGDQGTWYVNEDGYNDSGQRISTCSLVGRGSELVRSAGIVTPGSGAATGFCGPTFEKADADWSFDLHTPPIGR